MDTVSQALAVSVEALKVDLSAFSGSDITVKSPIDGHCIARLRQHDRNHVEQAVSRAQTAFECWRRVPAPRRGQLVRRFGDALRLHKQALGRLVTIETGKILQEGLGEVQEMIDICDFAVGLSRQLYGLTIASERPNHVMRETWHPVGPVGIISAFNFPVAVWSWNAAIALVCGDSVIWKPSEKTPLMALACLALLSSVMAEDEAAPPHLCQVLLGDAGVGMQMADDARIPVISATGSCAMGRALAPRVAARLGRTILELGGNNAVIVCPSADLAMAARAIVFGAVGTAGQRCTTTRRVFVHEDVYDDLVASLGSAYRRVTVGNPLHEATLVGPLIDKQAFDAMQARLGALAGQGASVTGGTRVNTGDSRAWYVRPALVEMPDRIPNVHEETFAPILYLFRYSDLDDAIARNNAVPQGLSSAMFTTDVRDAERFTSATGSDCGIANVNIGTSGAEIGGAFGGEKDTGGGRESGSDAWKAYMRRSTATINYGSALPLAQGIRFDI